VENKNGANIVPRLVNFKLEPAESCYNLSSEDPVKTSIERS
jgi:hypothetical protein